MDYLKQHNENFYGGITIRKIFCSFVRSFVLSFVRSINFKSNLIKLNRKKCVSRYRCDDNLLLNQSNFQMDNLMTIQRETID